MTSVLIAKNTV